MIADAAGHDRVITIEDGVRDGGIGMSIADAVFAIDQSTHVDVLGLPTKFIPHDPKSDAILTRFGLDADSIVELVRNR
jgi:1-deoxy-D-xylulose-5-phosphate synthase